MVVLVCNAGSSSLKLEVFDGDASVVRAHVAGIGRAPAELVVRGRPAVALREASDQRAAAEALFDALESGAHGVRIEPERVAMTVHRIVHGGARFREPVVVTDPVLRELQALGSLAPLHNPPAVAVLESARARYACPAVAVFDTAFFAALPAPATVYAVPQRWREALGARRYGFHGIAHESIYRRYRELAPDRPRPDRVVSFQLGQGCSVTALVDGRPVETSMGYTPLEGLIMGTRPGDVDAGVLLAAARAGETFESIDTALQRESGLRALAGSDDMRDITAAEAAGDPAATLAAAAFCHRAVKYLGAYSAVMGGLDAVLFGGGIGENAPAIRARICAGAQWLGLKLDARANEDCTGREGRIAAPGSAIGAYVIAVHEEAAMARAVRTYLAVE